MTMKATLLVPSVLALALLTACGGEGPAATQPPASQPPAPAESQAPAEVVSDLPVLSWVADRDAVPDFLSPELQALYLRAVSVRWIYDMNTDTIDSFPLADGSLPDLSEAYETIAMGEQDYFLARGRYAQWADFSAMVGSIFTPSLTVELLHSDLVAPTEDGRTAFVSAGRGANAFYDMETPDSFTLLESNDDYIVFLRTAHYVEPMTDDQGNSLGDFPYTRDAFVRMEHTDLGWRVAELELPY